MEGNALVLVEDAVILWDSVYPSKTWLPTTIDSGVNHHCLTIALNN